MVKYAMKYKKERFEINRLCEFSDKDAERDFMEYEKTASINIIKYLLLLFGFTFAIFVFSDHYFYGEGTFLYISIGLRGFGLLLSVIAFFVIKKFKRYEHVLFTVTALELLIFFLYLMNLFNLPSREVNLQFMSVVLFILAIFLIPNKWRGSLIAALIALCGYIICSLCLEGISALPSLTLRWIYLSISLGACAIFLFGREKSRRRQFASEKLLEHMSVTDRLTGIYNRGRFEYVLNQWIKNMRHNPFCLLLFDIDDFKKVNDRYGHTIGDQVLILTAETVSANIRDVDILARWGGEEFVILFGETGIERATELAERLRKAVEANSCGKAGHITISIGVAEYRKDESITALVNRADGKMYEAKRAGKNRVMADIQPLA